MTTAVMSGGCLCGAVRYEASGAPAWAAICYCRDCQRASGSGYMPVIGVLRRDVRVTGKTAHFSVPAARGGESTRHFCPTCGSLVLGGLEGSPDETMSIYVGTLDDPAVFQPGVAIFTRHRQAWDSPVAAVTEFDGMPDG
jgi:hypothetical protein